MRGDRREADGVRALAATHRIGTLAIGDAALVAAVAAEHRGAAFETCAKLVDTVKARLPVWKHQFFADGTDEWVDRPEPLLTTRAESAPQAMALADPQPAGGGVALAFIGRCASPGSRR